MARIPTVKIAADDGGYAIINEADFDAETMELFDAPAAPAEVTRASIDQMKKADLVELLEAHGADTDGNVPALKERLIAEMFAESAGDE